MIRFSCVHCGKVIQVKPELAGRKGKCPGCQAVLEIPAASATSSPSPPAPQQPSSAPPARKSPPAAAPVVASAPQAPDDFSAFDASAFSASPSPSSSYPSARTKAASNTDAGLPMGLGIGSLALGVISLFFTCCLAVIQVPVASVGLGLGIFGIVKSKGLTGAPRVLPILGTIFSSIGLLIGIVTLLFIFIGAPFLGDSFREKIEEMERQEKAKQEMDIDLNSYPTTEER